MPACVIDSFRGEHRWLSNFYVAPDGFCAEIVFQAAKTLFPAERAMVLAAKTPTEAKHLGYKVTLRPDWEEIKTTVMRIALAHKFRDPVLRAKLLATGDAELIEGNTWGDTTWGVCNHVGENRLGALLMDLRDELREPEMSKNSDNGNCGRIQENSLSAAAEGEGGSP